MSDLNIEMVTDKASLKRFIRSPDALYKNDPNYINPLMIERMEAFSKDKNPYFEHAKGEYWIAVKGGKDVGRISAQIDDLAQEKWGPNLGHFGCFEADCEETAFALFDTASSWLKGHGMTRVQGPWSLSANQEAGMLIDGFDTPPYVMMPHGKPEYDGWAKSYGFEKAKDLFAYERPTNTDIPSTFLRLSKMAERSKKAHLRTINMKKFDEDLEVILDIFNEAWSDNWGYVPLTKAEGAHTAASLKPIVKPHRTFIYEYEGEPVAFVVVIPDINDYIADLDGKLFPFGIFKLLWRIKFGKEKRHRTPLMGMRKKMQKSPLGAAMLFNMFYQCILNIRERGCEHSESSWILEDNEGMNSILVGSGATIYKTYRIYEKTL